MMSKNDHYRHMAPFYDRLAPLILGKDFVRSQYLMLDHLKKGDQVLILGGGTGVNLNYILDQIGPSGTICYVEASEAMLAKAKKRISSRNIGQMEFLEEKDFEKLPHKKFDWIITQYFLDVLTDTDLERLFEAIGLRLKDTTQWIFTDFFREDSKRNLIKLMIFGFRIVTAHGRKDLPDYDCFFEKYGWVKKGGDSLQRGFIQVRVYRFLPIG